MANATESGIDAVATHQIDLLRVSAGLRQAAVEQLVQLQGELVGALEKVGTPNSQARLSALLKQTEETIAGYYAAIKSEQTAGLKRLAAMEGKMAVQVVNRQIGADIVSVAIAPKTLEAIVDEPIIFGNTAGAWWNGQAADLRAKFAAEMRHGMLLGESVDQLAKRVRGTRTAEPGEPVGLMPVKQREAEALVRSSVISTANEARLRTLMEMDGIVKGIQWVSTLDGRTTPICRALDGKVWSIPDFQPVGHDKAWPGPTGHWGCRSTQVPVLKSWEELSGVKLPELDDATLEAAMKERLARMGMNDAQREAAMLNARASLDGQVGADMDFEAWLATKSDAFVERTLGPGRARLWASGQLTVTEMTDQTNRPLTLEQLAAYIEGGKALPETLGVHFLPAGAPSITFTKATEAEINAKSKAEMADILSGDDKLKKKWVSKVQAEQPDLAPKDQLSLALQKAVDEAAQRAKAKHLEEIKTKMLNNQEIDPAGHRVLNALTAEESKNFWDAYNDAFNLKKQAVLAKYKQLIIDGEKPDEATSKFLKLLPASEVVAVSNEAHAQKKAMKEQARAEAQLAEFAAKSPTHKAAVESAAGATPGEKLANALAKLDEVGASMLTAWETGTVLQKKIAKKVPKTWEGALQAEAMLAEAKAAANLSKNLAAAKKNYLAGKKLTSLQNEALLAQEDVDAVILSWKAEKEAMAAKALAPNTPPKVAAAVPETPPPSVIPPTPEASRPAHFPASPTEVKVIRRLGGSTGAELVEYKGKQFVRKSGGSPDHIRAEMLADSIYDALGVPVPKSVLYEEDGKVTKMSEFIAGKEYAKLTGAEKAKAQAQFRERFVVDALLGNWDVIGKSGDNVLWANNTLYRIDNGGSLDFRAMGERKTAQQWQDVPFDIFSMRDRSVNPSLGAIVGDMTIYDLIPQMRALDPAKIAALNIPVHVRNTLLARVQNLRDLAERMDDFRANSFRVDYAELHGQSMFDIREAKAHEVLLSNTTRAGTILKSENGIAFEGLRTNRGVTPTAAVNSLPSDTYYPTILEAVKNYNHHIGKGSTAFNKTKIAAAVNTLSELQKLQANGTADEKQMASQYITIVKKIEQSVADAANGKKTEAMELFEQFQTKPPSVTQKPKGSAVEIVATMLKEKHGIAGEVAELHSKWNSGQGSNSWSGNVLIAKYWASQVARDVPPENHYWEGNRSYRRTFADAKKAYDDAVAKYGKAKVDKVFAAYHALMQEQLERVNADYIDRGKRRVLLMRTEADDVMVANGIKETKTGDKVALRLGATESHSIFKPTYVYGNVLTVKQVPFSRVLYSYWFEARAGLGGPGFLGDSENEFAADTSGIPSVILAKKRTAEHPVAPSSKVADWEKAGVPAYSPEYRTGKL